MLRLGQEITVSCSDTALAAVTGWFCSDLERRTGIRARVTPGDGPGTVSVGPGDDPELARLAPPLGIYPADRPGDESYALTVDSDGVLIRAGEPVGAGRALTSLLQLVATTPRDADGSITLAARRVLDAPRFAWRGLSLDVARRFFPPAQIRRIVDLLALYKLNVLHLHLTDDEAWRIEAGRPAGAREPDGTFYTGSELRDLVRYAAERFVSVVPEIDSPGHAAALVGLRPELRSGRNLVSYKRLSGIPHRSAWLDPELPGTMDAISEAFAELAQIFPGPFVHVGGDEAWRMPEDAYQDYVRKLLPTVRDLAKRPIGWQELMRADADTVQAIQYWMSPASFQAFAEPKLPSEAAAMVADNVARTQADVERALRHGVKVLMSPVAHCYLDVPYAEESADPAQAHRRERVGLRSYRPLTLQESFSWEPVAALGARARAQDVAGVEAAIWCETVRDFDDLTFALLPRLPGIAEKAWGMVTSWADHSDALSAHGRIWHQDGLMFFRAPGVGWTQE